MVLSKQHLRGRPYLPPPLADGRERKSKDGCIFFCESSFVQQKELKSILSDEKPSTLNATIPHMQDIEKNQLDLRTSIPKNQLGNSFCHITPLCYRRHRGAVFNPSPLPKNSQIEEKQKEREITTNIPFLMNTLVSTGPTPINLFHPGRPPFVVGTSASVGAASTAFDGSFGLVRVPVSVISAHLSLCCMPVDVFLSSPSLPQHKTYSDSCAAFCHAACFLAAETQAKWGWPSKPVSFTCSHW